MPLTSANPADMQDTSTDSTQGNTSPQDSPDLSRGSFSVKNPAIPANHLPSSNPIMSATGGGSGANSIQQAASNTSGAAGNIGSAIGTIGGSILGGPVGGAVGGFLGKIFGGLFAGGGPVGYAQGGPIEGDPSNDALALGYMVGALHQRDFNGSPDTLPKAAEMIKHKLAGTNPQEGFASGGEVSNDSSLAQQALAMALGLSDNTSAPAPGNSGDQINSQTANAIQQSVPANIPGPNNTGYSQRLAVGGPPMPPQGPQMPPQGDNPPLRPGDTFQGDGSVKGPGGPTDDAIPARLSNGEYVISAPAVAFLGVDKLNKINEQGKAGYMESIGQVQANQTKGPQAAMPSPMQGPPPQSPPTQQPPTGAKQGGFMGGNPPTTSPTMRNRQNGYMGL